METKSLLIGIISFIAGALLVSTAATTFDKPEPADSMSVMVLNLQNKKGDAFDEAFINDMIEHHQAAVDMARLAETRAKHSEIKSLSKNIISAQEKEIAEMKLWRTMWNYKTPAESHGH